MGYSILYKEYNLTGFNHQKKHYSFQESITFEPALPSWKLDALRRLGMGNVAKVLLGGHVLLIIASSTVVAIEEVEKKRKEFKLAGLGVFEVCCSPYCGLRRISCAIVP